MYATSVNIFIIRHLNAVQCNASKEVRERWHVALRYPAVSCRFQGASDAWFKYDCLTFCNDAMLSVESCWYRVIWSDSDVNLLISTQHHDQDLPGKLETHFFECTQEEPAELPGQCLVRAQCYSREEEPCRIIAFTIVRNRLCFANSWANACYHSMNIYVHDNLLLSSAVRIAFSILSSPKRAYCMSMLMTSWFCNRHPLIASVQAFQSD